ncbi:Stem cell self-renewal protein Piwi [Apiospora phragmitis]|uniref:Stem cell self-renewal protein Piwi n=1 Tax=Apiospora phragmitis TaxID=2905665 RepID=A0ABR1SV84_9PEZI
MQALNTLGVPTGEYATDFKSQVILLQEATPTKTECKEDFTNERGVVQTYNFKLTGETDISFSQLERFLSRDQTLPAADSNPYTCFSEVLDAAGIVLGHSARSNPNINSLRSGRYFPFAPVPTGHGCVLPNSLMVIRGYFQSVRPASTPSPYLLLNTNVAYGVFRQASKLDEVIEAQKGPKSRDKLLENLNRQLAKAKIIYSAPGLGSKPSKELNKVMLGLADSRRSQAPNLVPFLTGVRFGSPKQVRFLFNGGGNMSDRLKTWYGKLDNKSGGYITVYDYFTMQFGKTLREDLPLIDIGTPLRPIFVPAELCKIRPGQLVASKLDAAGSSAMIEFACKKPADNQQFIKTLGRQVLQLDNNQTLVNFGLRVAYNLIEADCRLLYAPVVKYRNKNVNALSQNGGGRWYRPNEVKKGIVGKVFKPSMERIEWMYVHIHDRSPSQQEVQGIDGEVQALWKHLQDNMGLTISPWSSSLGIQIVGGAEEMQGRELGKEFQKRMQNKTLPKYLAVILPSEGPVLYRAIKFLGDHKLLKKQPAIRDGLGFKLNLKAGGVNHQLTGKHLPSLLTSDKNMFAGYDVTHPTNFDSDDEKASSSEDTKGEEKPPNSRGPQDEEKAVASKMKSPELDPPRAHDKRLPPSQIALVASVDEHLVTWTNPGKKELLGEELYNHFRSRLELYYEKNEKKLPESVVIYRDGVSEGQYEQVTGIELPRIRRAYEDICKKHKKESIAVTLVVAVKRHQTRFYPKDGRTADSKGNPMAGTVVDNTVTAKRHWDFYLQSHAAIKGKCNCVAASQRGLRTARPAHYTVLHDKVFGMAVDQLEQVTHCISYAFGRATKAVSLCTPAYYADMACTRARTHMWELYDGEPGVQVDEVLRRSVHDRLKDTMYYI